MKMYLNLAKLKLTVIFLLVFVIVLTYTNTEVNAMYIEDGGGDPYTYQGQYSTTCDGPFPWSVCYSDKVYTDVKSTTFTVYNHTGFVPGDLIQGPVVINSNYQISASVESKIKGDFDVLSAELGFSVSWTSSCGVSFQILIPQELQTSNYRIALVTADTYTVYKTARYWGHRSDNYTYPNYDNTYYTNIYLKNQEWWTWEVQDKNGNHLFYYDE